MEFSNRRSTCTKTWPNAQLRKIKEKSEIAYTINDVFNDSEHNEKSSSDKLIRLLDGTI